MLSDFLQFFLKNWDTFSTCHIFQVRRLKTPLVNLGKPVTRLLEIRVFIPIPATFSWRLYPCWRLAVVGLHSGGDWLDCLSLSHTFTSWEFFTVTTVCAWKSYGLGRSSGSWPRNPFLHCSAAKAAASKGQAVEVAGVSEEQQGSVWGTWKKILYIFSTSYFVYKK